MKILSALFDAVQLPVDIIGDVLTAPARQWIGGEKSFTRERIEEIEKNLRL